MTNSKMLKKASLFFMAIAACGFMLTFTSSNTEEGSNQQMIAQLSAELADMKTEVKILKEEKCNEAEGTDCYLGEIMLFAGNFAPKGTLFCNGQLLSIGPNSALFSLLGTYYGGDGRSTFALPDLRGRAVMHAGHGPGLSNRPLGAKVGWSEYVPVDVKVHKTNISVRGGAGSGEGTTVVDNVTAGSINITPPSATVNYVICMEGDYPLRN